MGSELPGTVTMPGAVGAGQVRMGGTVPGRGGKRRSGGWVSYTTDALLILVLLLFIFLSDFCSMIKSNPADILKFKDLIVILQSLSWKIKQRYLFFYHLIFLLEFIGCLE